MQDGDTSVDGGSIETEVLEAFPEVDLAFAYGSGAVRQGSYDYDAGIMSGDVELPMLDIIFAVEDSEAWHKANKKRHGDHYTSIIDLKPSQIATVQKDIGARVWFNAMVPLPAVTGTVNAGKRLLKYGVVETSDLRRDLLEWEVLYVAGRLHKPVQLLKSTEDLDLCMDANRDYAVHTALSMLPSRFSEQDLFMMIASLSYTGDPRMLIGENPQKVRNLVEPIMPAYRDLYQGNLNKVDSNLLRSSDVAGRRSFLLDNSSEARKFLQHHLPRSISTLLPPAIARGTTTDSVRQEQIRGILSTVVSRSATAQTAKGLFTVGATKSLVYAAQKIAKRFK